MDKGKHRFNERLQRVFSVFGSLRELADCYSRKMAADPELAEKVKNENNDWCGGSWADLEKIIEAGGWSEPVERSRAFAAKISTAVNSRGVRPCWQSDVVGAFADVPAYVAGAPESMRRRDSRADQNARAPLTLWVGLGASSEVSAADVERRGALVLAAYLALSRVRRVRIRVYSSSDRGNAIIDIGYGFSVAELCALVVNSNIYRRLFVCCLPFAVQAQSNYRGQNRLYTTGWAVWSHDERKTADVLTPYGFRDGDIILGPGKIGKWDGMTDEQMIDEINGFVRRAVRVG